MYRTAQYIIFFFFFSLFLVAQNFIVLASDNTKEGLHDDRAKYYKKFGHKKVNIVDSYGKFVLEMGPYSNSDTLTVDYLNAKSLFPKAFILDKRDMQIIPPQIQYIQKEVIKEDPTVWKALFALALIGILSLFISSDQIKKLKIQHKKIQNRQVEIEKKQSLLLEKMGEKIQTVALKNVNHEKKLLASSLEAIDKKEIKEQISNLKKYDEDLLRTTYEMIDFLKIKSGNIIIKQEAFQLSNMLHKLTNAMAEILKDQENTLIYDIQTNVSRYLVGDTERIYQVLDNLLKDIVNENQPNKIILHIEIEKEEKLIFTISNKTKYLNKEEIERLFIPTSWEEVQRSNKEFSFFVIKELIANMDGEFYVESSQKKGTVYKFVLPYIQDIDNKSRKEELKKILSNKKALVLEKNELHIKILTEILNSFGIEVIFSTEENLLQNRKKLDAIDFLIIKTEDITPQISQFIKSVEDRENLDIIVINSIFTINESLELASSLADIELFSPLILGDVEEVLKQLCMKKKHTHHESIRKELDHFRITDARKVSREDFKKFTNKTILIVEDNLVSQQVMSTILSASNLEVYKVENGIQALHFLEEHDHVDLIFMDMNMPVMDGFEASKKIRKHYLHKDVPIVAVTGLGFNYELEQMVLTGVNACIIKPFKVGHLYIALERFLEQQGKVDMQTALKTPIYPQQSHILDVQKGIHYVRSETFYKEIVFQILLALKNSENLVKEMILDQKIRQLRAFCIDTVGLCGTIGAMDFVALLNTILNAIQEEESLDRFIVPYEEKWLELEEEIRNYLK